MDGAKAPEMWTTLDPGCPGSSQGPQQGELGGSESERWMRPPAGHDEGEGPRARDAPLKAGKGWRHFSLEPRGRPGPAHAWAGPTRPMEDPDPGLRESQPLTLVCGPGYSSPGRARVGGHREPPLRAHEPFLPRCRRRLCVSHSNTSECGGGGPWPWGHLTRSVPASVPDLLSGLCFLFVFSWELGITSSAISLGGGEPQRQKQPRKALPQSRDAAAGGLGPGPSRPPLPVSPGCLPAERPSPARPVPAPCCPAGTPSRASSRFFLVAIEAVGDQMPSLQKPVHEASVPLGASDSTSVSPTKALMLPGLGPPGHLIVCEPQEGWAPLPWSLLGPRCPACSLAHSRSPVSIWPE